jgi:hypothetical protein
MDDNTYDNQDDDDDDRIIESGHRTSKIRSLGRGAVLMPQAVIMLTMKINPAEKHKREMMWGDNNKVYAPHADTINVFTHDKGRLAFCILEPELRLHTSIPGDTSLESHNVVNGLPSGIKVGMWHVQQLRKDASDAFGDQRQTSAISGTQTIINSDDETCYAGQTIYADLNPVKAVVRKKEEPGFNINGTHDGAYLPRTRGLDTNTVHAISQNLERQIFDYLLSIPMLEKINELVTPTKLYGFFLAIVNDICSRSGLAEDIPIRAFMLLKTAFRWSKIVKLRGLKLTLGTNATLGRLQHRVLAANTCLLVMRQLEQTNRFIKEDFDKGLPHSAPIAGQTLRDACERNDCSMFSTSLEALLDVTKLNAKLTAPATILEGMLDIEEAEARLDLNYAHLSEVCLFAQQFYFQTQTIGRALWTAAPGEPMAIHLR